MERVKKYGKLSMPERGERMKHNTKLSCEKVVNRLGKEIYDLFKYRFVKNKDASLLIISEVHGLV